MTDASHILVLEIENAMLVKECDLLRQENNTLRPLVIELRHELAMAKKVKHEDQEQRHHGNNGLPESHQ